MIFVSVGVLPANFLSVSFRTVRTTKTQKPQRKRRRKKKKRNNLEPIQHRNRLDLSKPADLALTPDEQKEMIQHLKFIQRFKGALRLSLNANEDLLVNQTKPPTDRGICKHLLAKIDGPAIDRALARDSLKTNHAERARFLAGIVRLRPSLSMLLSYLETLSTIDERRDAARGFALTVNTIDFSQVTESQVSRILTDLRVIFEPHDLIQSFFGLMDSAEFRNALASVKDNISAELYSTYDSLEAAYRFVIQEQTPTESEDWANLQRGVVALLDVPKNILKTFPLTARRKMVELASSGSLNSFFEKEPERKQSALSTTRYLFDSLPKDDPAVAKLRRQQFEQLLRSEHFAEAEKLLGQMSRQGDDGEWVKKRRNALSWPKLDNYLIRDGLPKHSIELREALWTEQNAFVWILTGSVDCAGELSARANLQSKLTLSDLPIVLDHRLSSKGPYYISFPKLGQILDAKRPPKSRRDQLRYASKGIQLLQTLSLLSVEIPDISPARWLMTRGPAPQLQLYNLHGIKKSNPASASIAHTHAAHEWIRWVFSHSEELPLHFQEQIFSKAPLAVLAQTIIREQLR